MLRLFLVEIRVSIEIGGTNYFKPAGIMDQRQSHIVEQSGKYCLEYVGVTVPVMVLS